jgi:predicted transcriptional regulator
VTNPLLQVHRAVWRRIYQVVRETRSQAPAARMVGEFAIKQVAKEANKNIRKVADKKDSVSE